MATETGREEFGLMWHPKGVQVGATYETWGADAAGHALAVSLGHDQRSGLPGWWAYVDGHEVGRSDGYPCASDAMLAACAAVGHMPDGYMLDGGRLYRADINWE